MTYLNPETVRETVAAKGTRFMTVVFHKKDGTVRKLNGLTRAYKHVKGTGRPTPSHLVAIWSPRDGWRSFDESRVVSIK